MYTSLFVCAFKCNLALAISPDNNNNKETNTIKFSLYKVVNVKKKPVVIPIESR